MKTKWILVAGILTLLALVVMACSSSTSSTPASSSAPAAASTSVSSSGPAAANTIAPSSASTLDGKTLVESRCTVCHNTDRIKSAHHDLAQWKSTVMRMVGKGAELNADEQQAVINYLAQTYP
jgi:cytochrome c5